MDFVTPMIVGSSYDDIVNGNGDLTVIEKLLKITEGIENFKMLHQHSLDRFRTTNDLEK
jgi:hypothetical protein